MMRRRCGSEYYMTTRALKQPPKVGLDLVEGRARARSEDAQPSPDRSPRALVQKATNPTGTNRMRCSIVRSFSSFIVMDLPRVPVRARVRPQRANCPCDFEAEKIRRVATHEARAHCACRTPLVIRCVRNTSRVRDGARPCLRVWLYRRGVSSATSWSARL